MEEVQYFLQTDVKCEGKEKAEKQQVYQNAEVWMGGKENGLFPDQQTRK